MRREEGPSGVRPLLPGLERDGPLRLLGWEAQRRATAEAAGPPPDGGARVKENARALRLRELKPRPE